MLDGAQRVKIVDFGHARVVAGADRRLTANTRGSLLWRAPEIGDASGSAVCEFPRYFPIFPTEITFLKYCFLFRCSLWWPCNIRHGGCGCLLARHLYLGNVDGRRALR